MNNQKILTLFKEGKREKAFQLLYEVYPKIEKLILSKGGQKQDASDVFQETLIVVYRNLEKKEFQLTSSFYTYIYSISRFIWKDIQRKEIKNSTITLNEQKEEYETSVFEEKKYQLAELVFYELGKRCQELLQLFYMQKMSFKQIADKMQFSSDKIAKNQKYKCLTKAKQLYRDNYKTLKF
jgi:RNA polymerase sigma factor (sigma-70 family)